MTLEIGWLPWELGIRHVLAVLHRELLLFAAVWLVAAMFDDLAIDLIWFRQAWARGARSRQLPPDFASRPLRGPIAVLIPAWREAAVIGTTVRHALAAWPQAGLQLYVGCYANDSETIFAAHQGAGGDRRARIVMAEEPGPTTKAACLNHLYRALADDEQHRGQRVRAVVLHDAEDMVHPAELAVFDAALDHTDFVQLPVRAEPLASSRWIAGHYLDEFAEAHGKTMVVRDALGAALPAAGVGCAFARTLLDVLADARSEAPGPGSPARPPRAGPFSPECLTEDYEIGWQIARAGGRARFLRLRDHAGQLVATRAYFPETLDGAVRQKTRWTHGIAYQAWDRLGWSGTLVDRWMALRDRRAPLAAAVLAAGYASLLTGLLLKLAGEAPLASATAVGDVPPVLAVVCLCGLAWRLAVRFVCSAHEYGAAEGVRAVLRVPVANVIAIAAAHRAMRAYLRALAGSPATWDKTAHRRHPAIESPPG